MQSKKIEALKKKKANIIESLNTENFELAKSILDTFDVKNEFYYSLYANYYYMLGQYEEGINILLEGLENLPYSYELAYNLASLKCANEDYVEGFWFYAKCIRIATTEDQKKEATQQFDELKRLIKGSVMSSSKFKEILDYANQILSEGDERIYPFNRHQKSLVKQMLVDSSSNEYFIEMYKSMHIKNLDMNSRFFFKTELVKGNKGNSFYINTKGKTALPIGIFDESDTDESDTIEVKGPKEHYIFPRNVLTSNQINYLTIEEAADYRVTSEKPFFLGAPIDLKPEKNSPQIILTIFIDGLSNYVIKDRLQELMPNTAEFFEEGYINNNCTTTGDWTLPSVASIYTGKTVLEHNLYHPSNHFEINKYNTLFTKKFKQSGYMTAQINNNWRITPTYGYFEDMDRILYQNYLGGFTAGEVVAETIEHLGTFNENNHFLWVGIEDLHDVADEINNDLMSQVHVSAEHRQSRNVGVTSVLSDFDPNKIKKYESELKRIDLHLSTIYNYLNKNYGKENFLVAIISDHGQKYLKQDDFLLHEPKREVPFMLVGKGVQSKVSNEIASIIDLYPTIAKLAGIEVESNEGVILKDFSGTGRDFSLTETIHPNQPYLVALTDAEHIFRFKTQEKLSGNGIVDLANYEAVLLEKDTLSDVTAQFKEKFESYCDFVINRAMKLQG